MDAQTFLDNFGTIAQTPSGTSHLRNLILNLAVQGQLVEQHSDDESIDQLQARLDSEKSRLAEAGAIRPGKSIPAVDKDEEPFAVPPSWAWVRLADVAWPQAGFAFKSDQFNEVGHGIPLIRIRDIANSATQVHFDGEFREEFLVDAGDYLVGMDGNFNVRQWAGPRALLNQRVTRLVFFGNEVGARFVAVALQHRLDELHGSKSYTTVQHLSGGQIAQSPIPLPPLAEQHRIVAKVDELMTLCDQLETQQQTRTQTATKLQASALNALTTAETADDLQTAWKRIHTNWETCTDDLGGVDKARKLILKLAVRGQLIEQSPDDECVDQLLVRLDSQKSRLTEEGAIRPGKSISPVDEDEEPCAVPTSWAWGRLADVAWPQAGFAFKSDQFNEVGHGTPLIRIRDIDNSTTQAHFAGQFREEFLVDAGDYLVGMDGNFNVRQWKGPRALLNQRVTRLVFFSSEVEARFIAVALQQRLDELHGSKAYTTVQHLSGKQIAYSPIPIPPVAEQHRIVAKIDELMALCDDLQARLVERGRIGEALAASVVDAFAA